MLFMYLLCFSFLVVPLRLPTSLFSSFFSASWFADLSVGLVSTLTRLIACSHQFTWFFFNGNCLYPLSALFSCNKYVLFLYHRQSSFTSFHFFVPTGSPCSFISACYAPSSFVNSKDHNPMTSPIHANSLIRLTF